MSVWGGLAALFSAVPFLSVLLPAKVEAAGFPPIGNVEGVARILSVVFALATTYGAFFYGVEHPESNRKRVYLAVLTALLPMVIYVCLSFRFVRTVEIPSMQTAVQVSVGWKRTEFAAENFEGEGDWELLRARGPSEEEIWRLWTPTSLIVSRLALYTSYLASLLTLVCAFSWGVFYEVTEAST